MLLDDLVSVIKTLQARIHDHGDVLRQNETRTRMALIDPLLQALGWDTADPGLVAPEYNVGSERVDYAMLGPDSKPITTVEAKHLGESLASHRMQMLNYSNAAGIAYAGLTDGNHWELYEVFKQGTLEERCLLQVSITDEPAHQCALKFLLLWRANLASGQPVAANQPLAGLDQQHGEQPVLPPTQPTNPHPSEVDQSATSPSESHSPGNAPPPGWVTLALYSPPSGTPHPRAIRFPDSEEHTIQHWYEVLTATVQWLVTGGLLTEDDMPFKTTTGRHLVNTEPVQADGIPFVNYKTILGGSLAVNTNLNAAQIRQNAKILLKHCNQDLNQVYLRVDQ